MSQKSIVLPSGNFRAHLYDCDGTLADTMGPHVEAWIEELASHGVKIDGSIIYELAGVPGTGVVKILNERMGLTLDPEEIAKKKEERFHEFYLDRVVAIEPVVEILKQSAKAGIRIAVVSGGRTRIVEETLRRLQIRDLVEVVICAEDVSHGKPHPEPFLMAAAKLGIEPEACLVFEDADLGIESARRAGMKWVRV